MKMKMENTTFMNCCPHVIKIYDKQPEWNTLSINIMITIYQSKYEIRLVSQDERKNLPSLYESYITNKRLKKENDTVKDEKEELKEIKVFSQQRFDGIMIYKDKK